MSQTIQLLNKLTGEITDYEINPNDPDALARAEEEAKAFIEEIDKFRAEIKAMATEYLAKNSYKPVEVLRGEYQWVYRSPITKTYSFVTARQFIDEDLLLSAGAVKVQTGALKKIAAQMVKDGNQPEGLWDALEATADAKASKPYVMLERLVRSNTPN